MISLLKSRDITLPTKVHLVKDMVFPVVMYRCECWTIKKAEHRRIDAFELWCWRRFLRVPWTARRSNQSIPKEISPGCSLQWLMLKLKLQYFGHLLWRADSLEKTLMLGKIEGGRRKGREGNGNPLQYSCLVGCSPWGLKEWNTTEQLHFHFSLSCVGEGNGNPLQCSCLENPKDGWAWRAAIYGVAQSWTRLKQLSSSSSRGKYFLVCSTKRSIIWAES